MGKPHYWTVELDPPPKARALVKHFVAMAETCIQTCVNLLGKGCTELPPDFRTMLEADFKIETAQGEMTDHYKNTLEAVKKHKNDLQEYDKKVADVTNWVAVDGDGTLDKIVTLVEGLQDYMDRLGTRKLSPAAETKLIDQVEKTIDAVSEAISKSADFNVGKAGAEDEAGQPATGSSEMTDATQTAAGGGVQAGGATGQAAANGSQQGAGGDTIGQLITPLVMLASTMAGPATQMVQGLIDKQQKPKEDDGVEATEFDPMSDAPSATVPAAAPAPAAPIPDPAQLRTAAAAHTTTAAPVSTAAAPGAHPTGTPAVPRIGPVSFAPGSGKGKDKKRAATTEHRPEQEQQDPTAVPTDHSAQV